MEIKIYHLVLLAVIVALLTAAITWKVTDNTIKKRLADPKNEVDNDGNIIPIDTGAITNTAAAA